MRNLNQTAQEEIIKIIRQLQNQEEIYQRLDNIERNLVKKEENLIKKEEAIKAINEEIESNKKEFRLELENLTKHTATKEAVCADIEDITSKIDKNQKRTKIETKALWIFSIIALIIGILGVIL